MPGVKRRQSSSRGGARKKPWMDSRSDAPGENESKLLGKTGTELVMRRIGEDEVDFPRGDSIKKLHPRAYRQIVEKTKEDLLFRVGFLVNGALITDLSSFLGHHSREHQLTLIRSLKDGRQICLRCQRRKSRYRNSTLSIHWR